MNFLTTVVNSYSLSEEHMNMRENKGGSDAAVDDMVIYGNKLGREYHVGKVFLRKLFLCCLLKVVYI